MSQKFAVDEFYMHEYALDTCIEVVSVLSQDKRAAKIVARYWCLGYTGKPWRCPVEDTTVIISADEFDFWVHLDYDLLVTPRVVSGVPKL